MMHKFIFIILSAILFSCNKKKIEKSYHSNGNLSEIISYKGDVLDGEYKAYYENGRIRAVGMYEEGRLDGIWEYWYEDGRLMSKAVYEKGKLKELDAWDKESNQTIINCNGSSVLTYPNGKPMSRVSYKNCKMHDRWVTWHENGKMASEMFYKDGVPTGEWKYWNIDGTLQKVEKY